MKTPYAILLFFYLFACTKETVPSKNELVHPPATPNFYMQFKGTAELDLTSNIFSIRHSNQAAFVEVLDFYYEEGAIYFQSTKLEFQLAGSVTGNHECELPSFLIRRCC